MERSTARKIPPQENIKKNAEADNSPAQEIPQGRGWFFAALAY
jgi:hypothetical protein